MVWPRGSWTDRMCPLRSKPNNVWQAGSPISSRGRRLRSAICAGQFPRANTILLGIAEASPYLFDLMRADAARVIRLFGLRSGAASGAADRNHLPRCSGGGQRSRGDAVAPPHEIGSRAADRAVRHRRRLAGDAGDGGADRSCGPLGAIGAALSAAAGSRARASYRRRSSNAPRTIAAWSCSRWARWAPAN